MQEPQIHSAKSLKAQAPPPNDHDKARMIREYIHQTTGTENHYRHALLPGFKYTDGVRFVAETADAHWLIDLIASHQLSQRVRREPFQVWTLEETKDGYRAVCRTDSPPDGKWLKTQKFAYTDFPKQLLPFTLWVENGVLILPAEH